MAPFVKCLLFTTICLMIGDSLSANSLDKRFNFAKRSDRDNFYNIYTKINAMEKDLKNMETKLQKRTKMLRQVLRSVIDIGLPDKNRKKQTNLASKKNGNLIFTKTKLIVYVHFYLRMYGAETFEKRLFDTLIQNTFLRGRSLIHFKAPNLFTFFKESKMAYMLIFKVL